MGKDDIFVPHVPSRRFAKRSEFEVSFHKNDQKIIINSHAILFVFFTILILDRLGVFCEF